MSNLLLEGKTLDNQLSLKKGITLLPLFAILTSSMIGMAWATLTAILFGIAGPAIILSISLAAVFCIFIGLCYAELCGALPFAGGEYVYSSRSIGKFWGFSTGWFLLLAYGTMMPGEVIILSRIISTILPGVPLIVGGIVIALIFGAINIIGVKFSSIVQLVLAALLFISMGIFIVSGIGSVSAVNFTPFFSEGIVGMITVIPLMMLAFMGFDIAPQAVEEVNAPLRKVVFLIPLSIVFVAVFYMGVFLVAGGAAPDVLMASTSDVPLIDVAAIYLGGSGATVIMLAGALGLITTLNAFMIGASRLMFGMAKGGALPTIFSKVHPKFGTPYIALIALTLFGIAGALYQEILVVFQLSSAAIVIVYILICLSVIMLRKSEPALERPYKVPLYPALPIIGMVASVAALLIALTTIDGVGFILFFIWLVLGMAYYFAVVRNKDLSDFLKHR
jgi:basic amino acid/polyamine antiporter, APA family